MFLLTSSSFSIPAVNKHHDSVHGIFNWRLLSKCTFPALLQHRHDRFQSPVASRLIPQTPQIRHYPPYDWLVWKVHSRSKHEFQSHAALFWLLLWLLIGPQGKTCFTVAQSDGQHPYLYWANTLASLRQSETFFCYTMCYFLKTMNTLHTLTIVNECFIFAAYSRGSVWEKRLWKQLPWLRLALCVKH